MAVENPDQARQGRRRWLRRGLVVLVVLGVLWVWAVPRVVESVVEDALLDNGYGGVSLSVDSVGFGGVQLREVVLADAGWSVTVEQMKLGWWGENRPYTLTLSGVTVVLEPDSFPETDGEAVSLETRLREILKGLEALPVEWMKAEEVSVVVRDEEGMQVLVLEGVLDWSVGEVVTLKGEFDSENVAAAFSLSGGAEGYRFGLEAQVAAFPSKWGQALLTGVPEELEAEGLALQFNGTLSPEEAPFFGQMRGKFTADAVSWAGSPVSVEALSLELTHRREFWLAGDGKLRLSGMAEALPLAIGGGYDPLKAEGMLKLTSTAESLRVEGLVLGGQTLTFHQGDAEALVEIYFADGRAQRGSLRVALEGVDADLVAQTVTLDGIGGVIEGEYDFVQQRLGGLSGRFSGDALRYDVLELIAPEVVLEPREGHLLKQIRVSGVLGGGRHVLELRPLAGAGWLAKLIVDGLEASALEPVWFDVGERLRGVLDGVFELVYHEGEFMLQHAELGMREGGWVNLRSEAVDGVMVQISDQVALSMRQALKDQGVVPSGWKSDLDGKIRNVLGRVEVESLRYRWQPEDTDHALTVNLKGKTLSDPRIPLVLELNVNGDIEREFDSIIGLIQLISGDMSGVDKL